ncbi:helix-turn-helix transcriptional regulator [Bowmanella dokdonensis]|uniref:YafY family transcriptional regulator n=1 Tax=Bowmanella dokdonensis TaxID=751969 RepID=A0A939IRN7_9ALTE|nr:YafY family protein [Bowmanella dokdonensis]MBN7825691.1 YafY family transcriptional regulator [Bowmanella dokdonensis]
MNRLFGIIQMLRAARHPIRAREMADEMEVSLRTIYRDIAELQMQGVPVSGEAGIGYVLKSGFEMPPLMLTPEELEAALLGTQWVARCGDQALMKSAASLADKIHAIVPGHLQHMMLSSAVTLADSAIPVTDALDMQAFRAAIRERKKVSILYQVEGKRTERMIWPILIGYFELVRVVAAWCELRQDFRHFRTDRIEAFEVQADRYPKRKNQLMAEWQQHQMNRGNAK